jgi:hypothetical protein
MSIQSVVEGIEQQIEISLGGSFSPLEYKVDIENNKFKGSKNKYGVRALGSSEVSGATCQVWIDQAIEITLTSDYKSSLINDDDKNSTTLRLQDLVLSLYRDIVREKCRRPSLVINTTSLETDPPIYFEDSKVCVVQFRFNIKLKVERI